MPSATPKTTWLQSRLWLSLILFWLVSIVGAGVLAQSGSASSENGWIILCMLALVTLCMATERGRWARWWRVVFVPVAWIAHSILSLPAVFTVGLLVHVGDRPELVNRATSFAAAVPIVLFAMRQSRLFIVERPVSQIPEGA